MTSVDLNLFDSGHVAEGPLTRQTPGVAVPSDANEAVVDIIDLRDRLSARPIQNPRLAGWMPLAKSAIERSIAALALVVLAVPFCIIAAIVRGSSKGPAFFRQRRVGLNGTVFEVFKFRTMVDGAHGLIEDVIDLNEHDGVLFKIKNDPRCTSFGKWLRRYSIDELPQLINVALGEMSLIGPRPALPSEVAQYSADTARRLLVKPGITGLWQVSGRSNLSWDESVALDLRYVEEWSLGLDASILLRTVPAVIKADGAY